MLRKISTVHRKIQSYGVLLYYYFTEDYWKILVFISKLIFSLIVRILMSVYKSYISRTIKGLLLHGSDIQLSLLCRLFSNLSSSSHDTVPVPSPEKDGACSALKESACGGRERAPLSCPRPLLLAVQGWSGDAPALSIEAYDPHAQAWFYLPQLCFLRRAYHGVALLGGQVYAVGGFDGRRVRRDVVRFDARRRRWLLGPPLLRERCYVSAVAVRERLFALGGCDGGDLRLRSCEALRQGQRRWARVASMHEPRSDASAAVHRGRIVVCGGFDGASVLRSVEVYDADVNQWTLVGGMRSPRSGHSLVAHAHALYALGGFDGERRLRTAERYVEEADRWVDMPSMLTARSNFAAAVLEDRIHVIGGYDGESTCGNVEKFDEDSDEWIKLPSLNQHRSAHGACVIQDYAVPSMCAIADQVTIRTVNITSP